MHSRSNKFIDQLLYFCSQGFFFLFFNPKIKEPAYCISHGDKEESLNAFTPRPLEPSWKTVQVCCLLRQAEEMPFMDPIDLRVRRLYLIIIKILMAMKGLTELYSVNWWVLRRPRYTSENIWNLYNWSRCTLNLMSTIILVMVWINMNKYIPLTTFNLWISTLFFHNDADRLCGLVDQASSRRRERRRFYLLVVPYTQTLMVRELPLH